jgi:MFS family permease
LTGDASRGSERLFTGRSGRLLLLLSVGTGVFTLGRQLVPPLLPSIIADLGLSSFEAGITLSVMSVATALCQYPSGRLSDQLSRETMLLAAVGIFLVGTVAVGFSPGYYGLLLGVAIYGAGNGLYTPAVRAKISDLFVERRGQAFGVNMTFIDVGGVAAAGLAVAVLAVATWRVGFLVVAAIMAVLVVPLARLGHESVDLSALSLDPIQTVGRLLRTSELRRAILAYSLFMFVYRGVIGFLPTFLQAERGFSPSLAAVAFAILFAMGILSKPIAGALSDRFPRAIVGAGALLLNAVGIVVLVTVQQQVLLLVGVVVLATGQKAWFPPAEAYLLDSFADTSAGGDLGATRTTYLLVSSVGPVYVGFVAARASYALAFAGFLVCLVVAATALVWDDVVG